MIRLVMFPYATKFATLLFSDNVIGTFRRGRVNFLFVTEQRLGFSTGMKRLFFLRNSVAHRTFAWTFYIQHTLELNDE